MMRTFLLAVAFLASLSLGSALPACKEGELNCRELCHSAQDKDCTSITGDCNDFCNSLTNVQDDAGCSDERAAYEDCLNGEGVCSGECDDEEAALSSCIGQYCLTRLTQADCMTLTESFN